MLREILTIIPIFALLLFVIPKRFKALYTTLLIGIGAVVGTVNALEVIIFGANEVMDALSAIFILTISVIGFSTAVYSNGYLKHYAGRKRSLEFSMHLLAFVALFYSMLLITIAQSVFEFLILWELMTLTSFLLVVFDAERKAVSRAAIDYLILMHIGYIFLIAAFTVSSSGGFSDSLSVVMTYISESKHIIPVFLLFFIGFGMKAGIFPLHFWLPEIYSTSPSHVSAMMSGAVTNMGIYGVLRVVTLLNNNLLEIGYIVLTVGIITALWGVIQCAVQSDIKRLLGYSSIENIGIIFIAIGLGLLGKHFDNQFLALCGFGAAMLHTFNHSCFKSMLFMSAGNIEAAVGTVTMCKLGGLSRRMPVTTILFLLGAVAIVGLPPLSGFVSEYMIYNALFETIAANNELVIISLVSIFTLSLLGGIALIAFAKTFSVSFLGVPRVANQTNIKEANNWSIAGQALPLMMILLVGLVPFVITDPFVKITSELFGIEANTYAISWVLDENFSKYSILMGVFIAIVLVLSIVKFSVLKRRKVTESVTWGCGFSPTNARMQYTGESFSETFSQISSAVTADKNKKEILGELEIFPAEKSFSPKRDDLVGHAVSSRWTKLFHRTTSRMALFQTGKVNHYILHALLFIALVLILTIIGAI